MANSSTLKTYLGTAESGPLIIKPVQAASLALQLTTSVFTDAGTYRLPRIASDPSAAWIAENAEIAASEAVADEVPVQLRKIAGLSVVSNETADDTDPQAAAVVGAGLARDIAKRIDGAFFGTAPANLNLQPAGLEFLSGTVTTIAANPALGIDAFIDALAAADNLGVDIASWVVDPATASALAKLKVSTGSNLPLFGTGAVNGIQRDVLGIPLRVSPYVVAGTAWGIPTSRVFGVIRKDVTVDVDRSAFFTKDQTAIRAVMRLGFGFVQPEAVVKIKAA